MNISLRNNESGNIYKILFQALLWIFWLGYPLMNDNDLSDPERLQIIQMVFVVRFIEVPFFYLIIKYLIPDIFKKHGVTYYLIILIAICISYMFAEVYIRNIMKPGRDTYSFFIIFPVIFIAAMGTGYGLVTSIIDEETHKREEDQQRLKSELSFLRSQISPHFLFNVLNSIVYLIRSKSDMAEPVTIQLSDMMRYMLYETDNKQVAVSKELEYLRNYIDLQKVRYGEDVSINVAIGGNDSSLTIEPMLLIPFVENAFKHGVGMVLEPKIDIILDYQGADLTFEVINKIGPETEEEKDSSSGIGLKNVRRRLELLYPDKHTLDINDDGDKFAIKLNINLKRQNN
ncbi:MAG: two-component system LytT family sensor kinase [Arcticibacterium sp.]|jgi:two-component system LytT family sensor kinase